MGMIHLDKSADDSSALSLLCRVCDASTREWQRLAWESGNEVGTGQERVGGFLLWLAVMCETNSAISYLQNHQVSPLSHLKHVVFKIQCKKKKKKALGSTTFVQWV